ncbi:hypothetical protein F52700_4949 [Fusarium sp. NRRL 52700]|nr:hypothetical protein F52700_4949 [Fusarium sp. NRRL 52700]
MDDVKFRHLRKPSPDPAGDASEPVGYNFEVEDTLRKQRAHFLVSHINKEDLSVPLNMLMFIHYRARLHPIDFAFQDNNRMHLGKQSHILSGACDPSFYVMFVPVNAPEHENPHQRAWCEPKIFSKHSPGMDEDRFEDLQSAGRMFGSMEAWLILQSQAVTYLFLATFCRHMLDLAKHELVTGHANRLSKKEILNIESSARQKINILKEKEGGETICMRSVLRRAFFEFFMWEAITNALEDFETFEQETLKEPPKMEEFEYLKSTAAPRPHVSEELGSYTAKYLQIGELIRHAAAFFIFAFRKEAIHAAYEPIRNTYLTTKRPEYRQDWLIREYYDSEDIMLDFQEKALHSDRRGKHRIVAELIENFISNKHSSMYVGIRKTTDKVKRHIEAHNRDAELENKFSNLISQTIDGLDLLADVAEHLELIPGMFRKSNEWTKESEKDIREMVSRMLQKFSSYDLLALDNCDFRDKHVPAKRTHRVFRFLDELQGFDVKEKEMSYGKAKGDIKRFGASLLQGLIYPLNDKDNELIYRHKTWGMSIKPHYGRGKVFPANGRALERLAKCMGITSEQFAFAENEPPLDFDAQGSNLIKKTTEEDRKITSEIWLALRQAMTKHRQEQKKKLGYQKKRNKDKVRALKPSDPFRISKDNKGKAPIRTTENQAREEMEAGSDVEMEDVGFEVSPMIDHIQPPNGLQETFNARPPRVRPQSNYKPPPPKPARRTEPVLDPTLAPDGLPKREINKHAWETLRSLTLRKMTYTNAQGKRVTEELPGVSLDDVDSTFRGELGFRLEYGKVGTWFIQKKEKKEAEKQKEGDKET